MSVTPRGRVTIRPMRNSDTTSHILQTDPAPSKDREVHSRGQRAGWRWVKVSKSSAPSAVKSVEINTRKSLHHHYGRV